MSISADEIKFYLTPNGNSNPILSLGGSVGGSQVSQSINGLFPDITPAQAVAGFVNYRAIDIKNTDVAITLTGAVVWISTPDSSPSTSIALAVDIGLQSIANEITAPNSPALAFYSPTTQVTGISLGNISPGGVVRVWLRQTVVSGASVLAGDAGAISVAGGTI